MGYLEDWNRGRNGELPNGRDNDAYREGLKARQDWINGYKNTFTPTPSPPRETSAIHHPPATPTPFTPGRCAKSGASLFAVCYALYAITSLPLSWAAIGIYTVLAAAAGALAGVLFFVATHLLRIALRVSLFIVGIAVVLYFFGYTGPLNVILRTASRFL